MNIGIDMMGGDYAPLEIVKGLQLFINQNHKQVNIIGIGDETIIKPLLA